MRSTAAFAPALALILLQACYEWRPAGTSLTQVVAARDAGAERLIRITRQDGSVQAVRAARIKDDSLVAFPATSSTLQLTPIPVNEVRSVEVRRLKKGKTIVAAIGLSLGLVLAIGAVGFATHPLTGSAP